MFHVQKYFVNNYGEQRNREIFWFRENHLNLFFSCTWVKAMNQWWHNDDTIFKMIIKLTNCSFLLYSVYLFLARKPHVFVNLNKNLFYFLIIVVITITSERLFDIHPLSPFARIFLRKPALTPACQSATDCDIKVSDVESLTGLFSPSFPVYSRFSPPGGQQQIYPCMRAAENARLGLKNK